MSVRCNLLLSDEFGRSTVAITHATSIYISGKFHLAKPAGRLVTGQEIFDVIAHCALAAIHRFGRTRGKRQYELLAFQFVARTAVGETVPEGFFHPTLQNGGRGVPEHGKLQHDDVGTDQALLFGFYIDFEVRVKLVKFYDFCFRQAVGERLEYGLVGH